MTDPRVTPFDWLDLPVEVAARRLLGCELERDLDGETLRVRIVETEAYDQDDAASHAAVGRTARNDAMFLSAGHLYVYFTRGLHHCCNVVTGRAGYGSGALIRAAEPLQGTDSMAVRRGGREGVLLTNGPGKLCQALAIDRSMSGHDLAEPPIRLIRRPQLPSAQIVVDRRVGITKAADAPRRFYVRDNPYVSKTRA